MANIQITQLPAAGSITGTELVPIVQNGVTVQTTTGAIAASPSQTQTFITKNQEPTLPNSRALSGGTGVGLVDGGAQSTLQITLNGASGSLESAGTGIIAKTGGATVAPRTLSTSGNGITVADGDGVAGNPTFSLTGIAAAIANMSGTGMLAIVGGSTIAGRQITGTTGQITVTDGNGSGNPTLAIADNVVLPGTEGFTVPIGTTAQRPSPATDGEIRYNTDIALFEGYVNGSWATFSSGGSGVTSVATGTGLTGGPITSTGTISIANTAVTAGSYGAASKTLTATVNAQGQLIAMAETPIAIANTQISGLGTMSTQDANAVAITGGTISGASVSSATVTGSTVDNTSVGATTPSTGAFTSVSMTSGTITTAPTTGNDIVNKTYADAIASGINFHQSCRLATTTALAANTYNNGSSGVGATLTANANGALSIDGVAVATSNRVLIKNEVTQANNGVYTVTQTGSAGTPYILTRATDFDSAGVGVDQIDAGDFFLITAGSTLANTSWVQQTPLPITVGTTAIVFQQFGAPLTYSAGTGLNESPAYTFNIATTGVTSGSYGGAATVPTYSVNAQGQLTVATDVSIAIAGSQITSGAVAIANGGTGQTSASAAFNALSPVTTTGDLIIGNGANSATRLAIGSNGYVLTSDGTTASWQASTGGVTSFSAGTTGFTPSTGTTGAVTLAGTLGTANGGTNSTATPTAGGSVYGTGTAIAYTAAGTAGEVLVSNGTSAPTWAGINGGTF